jgi:hypothetical protein
LTPTPSHKTGEKGEISEQKEAAAEEDMPYDTTTKTGKIAAALMTGEIEEFLLNILISNEI